MNRRDFVKYGLGGGGLAAGSGFVLRNEQKPLSTFSKKFGHPWWVKEIDKPKLTVDDNSYTRFNSMNNVFGSMSKYYGMEKLKELRKRSREKTAQYFREERPGFRLEDRALADAAWVISRLGGLNRGTRAWTSKNVTTPEERGVEKYSASPQEVARVIKAAARYFGAATVGVTVYDRRHINATERRKNIVFEAVDEPYEEDEKLVIPDKCKYAVPKLARQIVFLLTTSPVLK